MSVDEAYQRNLSAETDDLVGGAVDVLVEDVLHALLLNPEARDELVVAAQGGLVLQRHAGHHGVDALGVHLGEAQSAVLQEEVARVLRIVQVVGIVDDALDVALVVAHLHAGFKNVVSHRILLFVFSLQIFVSDATAQTVALVAVAALQLNQGLRVAGRVHLEAALLPHARDVILLGLQLLQQVEGAVAERLLVRVAPVGKEHGHAGVEDNQVDGRGRQAFGAARTLGAEGVVGLPVGGHLRVQHLGECHHVGTVEEHGERRAPLVVQVGQLGEADMGEVLRAQAHEAPQQVVHGLQRELMGQEPVFAAQLVEIAVGKGLLAIALGNGGGVEQSGLPHEDSLYLEEVVTVLAHGLQGDVACPLLEGVAVDAEAEVAGQRLEVGILPRAASLLGPLCDGYGLLLEALRLQSSHPGVYGEGRQRGDNPVTGRIGVGLQQFLVVVADALRHGQHGLRHKVAALRLHVAVGQPHDVEHHIIVMLVALVAVQIPVAGAVVQLDVAHPQRAAYLDAGVEEVGPAVVVVQSGVDHLYRASVGGGQSLGGPHLVFPAVVQQFLHRHLYEYLFQSVGGKDVLRHVLQLRGREGVDALKELVDVALLTVVQEVLGHVEGILLAIVAGDGYLPLQLALGGGQLAVAQRVLHQAVELAADQSEAALHVVVVAAEVYRPAARVAVAGHGALYGIYQSVAFAQRQVQTGIHGRTAQQVVEQVEGHAAGVAVAEGLRAQHDVGLVVGGGCRGRHYGMGSRLLVRSLPGGSLAGGLPLHDPHLQQMQQALEVDVAIDEEDGIVGTVVAPREATGVGTRELLYAFARAQDVVAQRMTVEQQVLKLVVDKFGGRVVVALYLVADDVYLVGQFLVGIAAAEDDVAQQVDGTGQVFLQDGGIEHGVLLIGEGVQVASHTLQAVQYLECRAALRALETDVLTEMGQPLLALGLVARTGADADATVDDGRR